MQLDADRKRIEALLATKSTALAEAREEVARLTKALHVVDQRGTVSRSEATYADHELQAQREQVRCVRREVI